MDSIFDLDHLYRTYFKMALPSVFGLMVSVVYNLADTFFIAQSNDTALIAGVSPGRQLTHFPPAGTGRP